ncbi:hypothetical protein NMY22_g13571 [Coprinellus aureogranulatus]|nr:hypothetical protein NMY22_g13571 [Coprinellus aureogranulatus]
MPGVECRWCREKFASKFGLNPHNCKLRPGQRNKPRKKKPTKQASQLQVNERRASFGRKLRAQRRDSIQQAQESHPPSPSASAFSEKSLSPCYSQHQYHPDNDKMSICNETQELRHAEESIDSECQPNVPSAMRSSVTPSIHGSDHRSASPGTSTTGDESAGQAPTRTRALPAYFDLLPSAHILTPAVGFTKGSAPFQTQPDSFRQYRVYPHGCPSYTPDAQYTLGHFADSSSLESETYPGSGSSKSDKTLHEKKSDPDTGLDMFSDIFPNPSIGLLLNWFLTGESIKSSKARVDALIKDVLQHPLFQKEHLAKFRMDKGLKLLDEYVEQRSNQLTFGDEWSKHSVEISAPCDGVPQKSEGEAHKFKVENIHIRNIMDVIRSAVEDPMAEYYHLRGYKSYQLPDDPNLAPIRQYDEVYTSNKFLQEEKKVLELAKQQGCEHEAVMIAIMFGSDSTRLAQFGSQTIWPMYMWFGNLSKYVRTKPSTHTTHHIAYIPKLPAEFDHWYNSKFGKGATRGTRTHMRRELYQAVILLLLNHDLMHAYLYGEDMVFWDHVIRRAYPRFFTDSLDYAEKILFACVKNLSTCPCTRCLVAKSKIDRLGTKADFAIHSRFPRRDDEDTREIISNARELLYELGVGWGAQELTHGLGPKSLNPTQNAFSRRFQEYKIDDGFNFYEMIAPDFLHEVDLGVVKDVFTHALRLVLCEGSDKLIELNERYRNMPTFGRDTIRKFSENVSAMQNWAAWNFEDALQCAIPAFSGLLPEPFNTQLLRLFFELATWHALAKLRRHNDATIADLKAATYRLGKKLRKFAKETAKHFDTRELPSEETARNRGRKQNANPSQKIQNADGDGAPKRKIFNMFTYKIHALGHYPEFIQSVGTTDNYSAHNTEHAHKRPKRMLGFLQRHVI